ncbi:MAG: glycosyltransferase family 1 protein [Candidatus Viridilinea halotolerans]|uniref:Glycosyltransferase family 1 protein n=1 Tax=Candidatus Viridilinea halotolerans TaxID=2491704 RepID=A0A426U1M8_9CHLR|nr:MAG: glycosyltransferase family 1 protein [Candidatus Viridilinea halotolerans]
MQIVINGSFWGEPNVGSGQYLHGLVRWLPQIAPQQRYILLVPARSPHGPPPPAGVSLVRLRTPFDRAGANLAKLTFEQLTAPVAARHLTHRHGPAVLLTPYFAPPLVTSLPVVTTVGDIIPLLLPEYRGRRHVRAYMALVRQAVRRSAHVLTFSTRSRNDILKHLRLPAERVTSILLAAGDQYTPGDRAAAQAEVARRYGLEEPFVYYVGGLDARKNLGTLLRAFALLRSRGVRATLAIAGRALGRDPRLFPDLDALIADLNLGAGVRRIDVPPEDGPLLYRACTVFAFPSRYEGFGLPPLEAMACGAPVIVSDASSLPEVVGPAALRVAPDDVVGWAATLGRLLADPRLRAELTAHGLAQAARFSYRHVAAQTLAILERVAQ